jgi:alkaline phosphatase D
VGQNISQVSRTKTAPRVGTRLDRFVLAFAGCQNYPTGFCNGHAGWAGGV